MFDQTKIGAFIAAERKSKGLTQAELAAKLGVSDKSVSRWETGKTMPDYALLPPLCEELGISINELFAGERVSEIEIVPKYDENLMKIMKEYRRMKITRNVVLIVAGVILALILQAVMLTFAVYVMYSSAKVEVNTDISKYEDYLCGETGVKQYRTKWGMDESIFPRRITDDMTVTDYKMVYYAPWDAQFLSYLTVEYSEEGYKTELARLEAYESTDYIGYYGVTGFTNYDLLAMYADSYNGFVYALTDGNSKIIYVEIIFCNYFMDLEYNDYIPAEYLPDGFDASSDNAYMREMTN